MASYSFSASKTLEVFRFFNADDLSKEAVQIVVNFDTIMDQKNFGSFFSPRSDVQAIQLLPAQTEQINTCSEET